MNPLVPTEIDVILTIIAFVVGAAVLAAVIIIAVWLTATERVRIWPRRTNSPRGTR